MLIEAGADLVAVNNADFNPSDAATDTVEGRFRGPSQDAAAEVLSMINDAKANPEKYGRPPNPPPKTKKRRKKKSEGAIRVVFPLTFPSFPRSFP